MKVQTERKKMGFTGITQATCAKAWNSMVFPSLAPLAGLGIINKYAGCIVVLDPNSSEFAVLFSATINSAEDDQRYMHIAMAKAEVSRRTGLSSSLVQTQYPHLYTEGDTKWGGSTVDGVGLVVAFSGVQAVYDEMISEWMASAIRALCRNEMTKKGGVMDSEDSFLYEN